jgi:hypothetical protein
MKSLFFVAAVAVLALLGLVPADPVAAEPPEPVSVKGLPGWYRPDAKGYKADPYIAAAAKLRAAGKDKAVETLRAAAKDRDQPVEQVIVLCRMLFTAKSKKAFERPGLGAPGCLGGTDMKDWPSEPIELVDGVPFLIVVGYTLAGFPEPAEEYLDYCVKACDWGAAEFEPKTAAEKGKALDKLLASPKWKRPLKDWEKEFLAAQIK